MDPIKKAERFERKRGDMNARALAALERLLAGGGSYQDVTIGTLVAELGISRATLYAYYEDKNDVLRVLAEDVLHTLLQTADGWLGRTEPLTEADLRDTLSATLAVYVQHATVLLAIAEVASYDEAMRNRYEAMLREADAALEQHMRLGQKRGFVDPGLQAKPVGTWLTRMIETGMLRFLAPRPDAELDTYVTAITRVVWNVLYAPVGVPKAAKP